MRGEGRIIGLASILLLIAETFLPGSHGGGTLAEGRSGTYFYESFNSNGHNKGAPPNLVYRFLEQSLTSRGCTVSMKCIATGSPTPTIKWLMDGFQPPTSERFMIGQYVTLGGDVISHFNVTACNSEDSAEISCTAKNDLGGVTHKARLNIFGPPFVRDFRRLETAVSGKDFSIKCPVGGYPIDHISWYKEQKQLPLTSRQSTSLDGILTIKNVQKSDKGNYTCLAKYKDLSHSNSLLINVVVPPKLNYFRPQAVVEEGERVVKYCEAVGDTPIELEWLRDGVPLHDRSHPDILIQHIGVDIALVLIITQVSRQLSNTNFTCVARNDVSPSVTKFQFPEVLEGMRVSVHCAVSNYAEDMSFVWLKDGVPLRSGGQGSRIVQLDPFSSILSVENVSQVNTGNYSCLVSNPFGNSSHTAKLTVFVPPKWTKEPVDIEGVEGETILSPCEADAYPPPTISWKKAVPGRTGAYVEIPRHQGTGALPPNPATLVLPNGTLFISTTNSIATPEGKILTLICEAENGIGSGISKLIHLRINAPVRIHQPGRNATVRSGTTGTVRCVISGDHPIHLNWFHGQEEVIPIINQRYQIKTVNTSNGISSELTLINIQREDTSHPLLCTAKNLCSSSCRVEQQEMWLIVLDPPERPRNLTVLVKGSRFIELGWKFRRGNGDAFTRISVKYKIQGGPWNTLEVTRDESDKTLGDLDTMSTLIDGLKPASSYHFIVTALNVIGSSESTELSVRTNEEPPDQTPRNVLLTPLGATQVKVEWDVMSWNNGDIRGYDIGIRKYAEASSTPFVFTTLENPTCELILRNLRPFTGYEVVVRVFNGMGPGPLSKPLLVTTLESLPMPPNGLNCYTLTSQKLQLSWNGMTEEESRGLLRGYKIFIQRAHLDFLTRDDLLLINTTETTVVVENLSKFTMYEIQILAHNNKGDGELSPSVYCQTEADVPGPPEQLKVLRIDVQNVLLAWTPPSLHNLNGEVTHYTVYLPNELGRTVPPNITQIEVKPRFQPFVAHVSASTKIGQGSNATTSFHPEIGVGGGLISFGKLIHVLAKSDLSLPCVTAVGKPLRTWFHQSKIIQENERRYTEPQGSFLRIKGATEEDGGNYSCFQPGFTWEGTQFKPERISYVLMVQAPPPPPKLREHEVGANSISLRWSIKDGGSRGGGLVEGFLLQLKIMDEWLERKLPRRLTSYILRDLHCGTIYPIYLTAYNKAGMSKPSQLLNITTKGGRPTVATSPELLAEVNNTWIRVSLHEAFNDGGCPIFSYRILYRKKYNELHWKSVEESLSTGKKHVDLLGLDESTNYLIKIWSENEAGRTEITFSVKTFGITAEPSNNLMSSVSESLNFNFKVFGPILLGCLLLLILISAVFLVFKRRAFQAQGEETTGDSFTYFKQNVQHSQSQNQEYMTIKKSTPSKGPPNNFDLIPHSPDGVLPYATFELKDSSGHRHHRRRSGPRAAPPIEQNPFYISREQHICNAKSNHHHHHPTNNPESEEDEDEEYERISSDSDSFRPRRKFSYEQNGGSRYANHYEPANNHKIFVHEAEMYQGDVKSCRGKNKGASLSVSAKGCGKPTRGGIILCDEQLLPDEDLCQIKV